MTWLQGILLVSAGLLVGFINTLAGGGSVVSLSILMFLGLPAPVANGTNRIGILLQTVVSVRKFHTGNLLDWKKGLWLAIPAVTGALVGSQVASHLNEAFFEKIIAVLLLFIMLIMIIKPEKWLNENYALLNKRISIWQILIFLAIGFYGGFIQAGVGFFLLAGLVLGGGYELVRANALKNLIILLYTPFALAVFIFNNQVDYLFGFTLAAGNMLGAWLASRMAINKGASFVRWIIFIVIILTVARLLGGFDLAQLLSS